MGKNISLRILHCKCEKGSDIYYGYETPEQPRNIIRVVNSVFRISQHFKNILVCNYVRQMATEPNASLGKWEHELS